MAFISSSSNSNRRMLSLQILLISFGVVFAALILNLSLPLLTRFLLSDLPFIWNSLTLCFKPPYLYLLFNCIILMLIASNKFHHNNADTVPLRSISLDHEHVDASVEVADVVKRTTFPIDSASVVGTDTDIEGAQHMEMIAIAKGEEDERILFDDLKMDAYVEDAAQIEMTAMEEEEEEEKILSSQSWNLAERSVWDEKPPRSNRFNHRKPNKSNNIDGIFLSLLPYSRTSSTLQI